MPPEIFHEVGQQKQQQYNQGVQLVQNQINNVAGLDVSRPIDKDYLHSKLNELGSNITGFLASDFSANSVLSLTLCSREAFNSLNSFSDFSFLLICLICLF